MTIFNFVKNFLITTKTILKLNKKNNLLLKINFSFQLLDNLLQITVYCIFAFYYNISNNNQLDNTKVYKN